MEQSFPVLCSFIALQWTGCNSWFNILFTDCTWAMTWSALSSCWRTRGGYREENMMFKVESVTQCGFYVLICKVPQSAPCWFLFYFIFNQQFHLCYQLCSKKPYIQAWNVLTHGRNETSLHWKQVKYPDCIVGFNLLITFCSVSDKSRSEPLCWCV